MAINFPDPSASPWYNDPASGGNGVTYVYTSGGFWTAVQVTGSNAIDQTTGDARYVNVSGDSMTGGLNVAGNVGIGTTTVDELLHLEGSTSNVRIKVESTGTNSYPGVRLTNDARTYDIQIDGATDNLRFYDATTASERVAIDSSGRLLVGTSSSVPVLSSSTGAAVQVDSSDHGTYAQTWFYGGNSQSGAAIMLAKSRNSTYGSYTAVQNDDSLGGLFWAGDDGSDLNNMAASILCRVDGTAGTNDMPGRLVFSTTADGSSSPTERLRIDSSGNVGINNINPDAKLSITGAYNQDGLKVLSGGANYQSPLIVGPASGGEYMRVDGSGRLLVGTSSARTNYFNAGNTPFVQIEGYPDLSLTRNANDIYGATVICAKTRSTGNTIVQNNDVVGLITFQGNDGSEFVECANIKGEINGTPGANDMPGRLVFSTTADGATAPTERMRIDSSGNLGIGRTNPGEKLDILSTSGNCLIKMQAPVGSVSGVNAIGSNVLVFQTGFSERMRIDSNGLVTIDSFTNTSAGISLRSGFAPNAFGGSGIMAADHSGSSRDGLAVYGHDGVSIHTNGPTERWRLRTDGYVNAGQIYGAPQHRFNGVNATVGTHIFTVSAYQPGGGTSQDSLLVYGCDSGGVNGAASGMKVQNISSTGRSINTAGTVNASGTDYAEYMTKAGDFTLAKGDICGINSEGKLTNIFDDAIGFVVKSTKPSYVGGDVWHKAIGEEPGGYGDDRTKEEIAAAKVVYQEALETARQSVDRIAFSGQVPVNVTGATAGQYIIPVKTTDGGITGEAKNEADLTLAQYMQAVGKVITLEEDGRATIIVKVA